MQSRSSSGGWGGSVPRGPAGDPRAPLLASDDDAKTAARSDKETVQSVLSALVVLAVVSVLTVGPSKAAGLPIRYVAVCFALQWLFFLCHGWPFRSEKLYDASGSLTHLSVVIAALTADTTRTPRQIVNAVLAVVWCTRLGTFLFNRIAQDSKDDRFTALKTRFSSFSIAWHLQVAWVFLLQLPVLIINSEGRQPPLSLLDVAGWSMWFTGFLVESIADSQKFAFRGKPENKGRFITSGLWRYSRHPNYFGEILMWVGICTSGAACFRGAGWLGWVSPVFNAFLLLRVSGVPLLEKAGKEKWGNEPAYNHYMANTSCIVPWKPAAALPEGTERAV